MQSLLRENKKQLLVGVAISVLLIGIGIVKGINKAPSPQAAVTAQATTAQEAKSESVADQVRDRQESERREKALAAIEEHKKAIERDWHAEDAPDRMMAIGNLYQYQLKDYYSAIQSYRDLVANFPDNSQAAQAYVEIAGCYEKMGDEVQARYVYQEMVDALDPSLEHVKYAKLKLGER